MSENLGSPSGHRRVGTTEEIGECERKGHVSNKVRLTVYRNCVTLGPLCTRALLGNLTPLYDARITMGTVIDAYIIEDPV